MKQFILWISLCVATLACTLSPTSAATGVTSTGTVATGVTNYAQVERDFFAYFLQCYTVAPGKTSGSLKTDPVCSSINTNLQKKYPASIYANDIRFNTIMNSIYEFFITPAPINYLELEKDYFSYFSQCATRGADGNLAFPPSPICDTLRSSLDKKYPAPQLSTDPQASMTIAKVADFFRQKPLIDYIQYEKDQFNYHAQCFMNMSTGSLTQYSFSKDPLCMSQSASLTAKYPAWLVQGDAKIQSIHQRLFATFTQVIKIDYVQVKKDYFSYFSQCLVRSARTTTLLQNPICTSIQSTLNAKYPASRTASDVTFQKIISDLNSLFMASL